MADSLATSPFKTRPSTGGNRKVGILCLERPVGIEDGDQEGLGRLVVQAGEIGADLDAFLAQAVARGAQFLEDVAPAVLSPRICECPADRLRRPTVVVYSDAAKTAWPVP